jgi:5'-3' exonuclease
MNTTLIIDGNWLLMSRLFVVKQYFDISNNVSEKENGTHQLQDLMCRSINIVINKFDGIVDNIILVSDLGSWRKKLKKPGFFHEDYKGTRIKDSEIDWPHVYKALDSIVDNCKKLGITACKEVDVEGDDWVYYWSRYLNSNSINCIIWSSDRDLQQLVQVDNFAFTAWFNESQKGGLPGLFLHKSLKPAELDDIDQFMQIDNSNILLDSIQTRVSAITYIDPADIIEEKIICGDISDNIKSICTKEKNGRMKKITEKMWNSCKDATHTTSLKEFFENKNSICTILNEKFDLPISNVLELFDYNTKLVYLNDTIYPQEILDIMNNIEYKKFDLSYIKNNYKILASSENETKPIEDIFDSLSGLF